MSDPEQCSVDRYWNKVSRVLTWQWNDTKRKQELLMYMRAQSLAILCHGTCFCLPAQSRRRLIGLERVCQSNTERLIVHTPVISLVQTHTRASKWCFSLSGAQCVRRKLIYIETKLPSACATKNKNINWNFIIHQKRLINSSERRVCY